MKFFNARAKQRRQKNWIEKLQDRQECFCERAYAVANFLKNCRGVDKFYASVKVDMSEAYDRVEWVFLERVLLRQGFAEKWVNRIMKCLCSVSYQIKVNDNVSDVIVSSRGHRQGDPLSPYLFLLCTELLRDGVKRGHLSGIRICRNSPIVSHLFFADDSILFLKEDSSEVCALKIILHQYENISDQLINFEKSEICFSRNTLADVRLSICNVFRDPQVRSHSKYLGLPLLAGQRKTQIFRDIVDKVWRRVKDWKCRLLSAGGRKVLIKAVIQVVPTYMMSVYYFPRRIIDKICKLVQQFLCGIRKKG
ncbi:hypothetical protein QQ045_012446 [Rhodiola kirilowii]